jgi:membrane protease YdiL (CAAX protease family)
MVSSHSMHWDFALILLFLGTAVPLLGRRRIRLLLRTPHTTKADRLVLYASTVAFQWLATGIIFWRTGARGILARSLGVAVPNVGLTAAVTVCLTALILANQILSLNRLTTRPAEVNGILPQLALKIFPQDGPERLAFLPVVATVALCEELIYRGFVQYVFDRWFGGIVLAAIFGSAAMFALAHLYQGRRGVIATFVVGLLFSAVRAWTGSLLPSAVAHFAADLTAGLLTPSRIRASLGTNQTPLPLHAYYL